ncbi:hypothetical protein FB563_8205 [Streptomyces puniciscabiei]|uniref:Uncharacterized protein n=1 Tax=Streptomyces puniciscabiei TaxID=164348 RepID=A0A542SX87_9ACTN|nr:hypothetical protein [Streptomyces puniciscabiei]TQK79213.1 hypothetical protein FB563_8205 [Streptomyces puniciscabiei]
MTPTLERAAAFHQAVLDDHDALAATLSRLREQTQNGDYAYYIDIVSFMAGLPLPADHTTLQWLDSEQATRTRWRTLVTSPPSSLRRRSSPPHGRDELPGHGRSGGASLKPAAIRHPHTEPTDACDHSTGRVRGFLGIGLYGNFTRLDCLVCDAR